jgi:hypothetical protein
LTSTSTSLIRDFYTYVMHDTVELEKEKEKCNFKKRLNNCISTHLTHPLLNYVSEELRFSYAHMCLIFMIPVVCAIGIYTSILVIRTITLIKKEKELKDRRHYDFMRINAATNCGLFSIKIVGLINECTSQFWCSPIHRLVGVQYFKLIVGELLGSSLRFFSNFTYVAFQLCRLSLIGQEHGKLVEKVSLKMSIKRLVAYFACLSFVLSIVKYFCYQINDEDLYTFEIVNEFKFGPLDEFPARFSSIDNKNGAYERINKRKVVDVEVRGGTMAFIILNILCDILNYPVFFVICLVLDIVTCVELRKTLLHKVVTNKKVEEEKEEAIFKSTLLIILNALCNCVLKLPTALNSIFEIIVSLNYNGTSYIPFVTFNHFLYFLVDLNGRDFLENVCNFLYFLSLTLNFVFYYNFDRMFRFYFRKWYFKEKTPPTSASAAAVGSLQLVAACTA